jgi:hypothetical protein
MVHRLSGNFSHPTTERRRSKAAGTSWGGEMTDPYDQYANEFESGENPLGEEGCLFPEQCCMAFCTHYTSECYTPEMYEALEAEYRIPEPV